MLAVKGQNSKDMSPSNTRKTVGSIYMVQSQNKESSEKDQEASVLAERESSPNSPSDFKFPCPMKGHKHKLSKCMGVLRIGGRNWKRVGCFIHA